MDEINWTQQWEQFAPNFREGYAHIDLARFGAKTPILLKPGPGFGDLSHPTTRLTLEMMGEKVQGRALIDIGAGSGILTLSAWALGAKSCLGIEIEPDAVLHARENAKANQADRQVKFFLPNEAPAAKGPLIILMNMILSEQRAAKGMYEPFFAQADTLITSGVLSMQRDLSVGQAEEWGWRLVDEKEEEGWMAFLFKK
jgi:ribosomal protein L11 methyltransferase